MKALVVYESLFGNTEQVALAITSGLSKHGEVELIEVTDAPAVITEPFDLLVLGGTHAFSMTRPSTREDAFRQGATQGSTAVGLREWLEHLTGGPHSELVATFDTRVAKVRHLPGSAAKGAAKVALKLGYEAAAQAESFYVEDVSGPLVDGELSRAQAWGEQLGAQAAVRAVERGVS
jgi:Flavodoxins